jgi:colanic acid biosynthesis glycosyl transferase WcaI
MRILIITHIFWPETHDFRNRVLAAELVSRGHDVTVLTAFPNYPHGRLYEGYRLAWRQWECVDGIRVLRVPLYIDQSASGFKRILNYGSFTLSASTLGLALAGKVDVVFVHSPPMTLGLTAGLFKWMHHAPVLLDVVDLWPDAVSVSDMVTSDLLITLSEWIARCAYKLADRITLPTDGFASRLESLGVTKEKISVVPNWADGSQYSVCERNHKFGDVYGLKGRFCIIHAGNIGYFQNIENILSAAELVRHIDRIRIIFVGSGRDIEKMKAHKEARKLDNVIFAGTYSPDEMSSILAWGDGLLVSLRAEPYLAINLPSKVPAYMAAGRPIIASAEGETARLVNEYRLGIACKPCDPEALADAFLKFMQLSEEEHLEMGKRSRIVFKQLFDKDMLIGKYVNILEKMGSKQVIPEP